VVLGAGGELMAGNCRAKHGSGNHVAILPRQEATFWSQAQSGGGRCDLTGVAMGLRWGAEGL